MGSEKYPDENAFDAFIKKHGGSTNAFTSCERVSMFQHYSELYTAYMLVVTTVHVVHCENFQNLPIRYNHS